MNLFAYLDNHQVQAWVLVLAMTFAIAAVGNGLESLLIGIGQRKKAPPAVKP